MSVIGTYYVKRDVTSEDRYLVTDNTYISLLNGWGMPTNDADEVEKIEILEYAEVGIHEYTLDYIHSNGINAITNTLGAVYFHSIYASVSELHLEVIFHLLLHLRVDHSWLQSFIQEDDFHNRQDRLLAKLDNSSNTSIIDGFLNALWTLPNNEIVTEKLFKYDKTYMVDDGTPIGLIGGKKEQDIYLKTNIPKNIPKIVANTDKVDTVENEHGVSATGLKTEFYMTLSAEVPSFYYKDCNWVYDESIEVGFFERVFHVTDHLKYTKVGSWFRKLINTVIKVINTIIKTEIKYIKGPTAKNIRVDNFDTEIAINLIYDVYSMIAAEQKLNAHSGHYTTYPNKIVSKDIAFPGAWISSIYIKRLAEIYFLYNANKPMEDYSYNEYIDTYKGKMRHFNPSVNKYDGDSDVMIANNSVNFKTMLAAVLRNRSSEESTNDKVDNYYKGTKDWWREPVGSYQNVDLEDEKFTDADEYRFDFDEMGLKTQYFEFTQTYDDGTTKATRFQRVLDRYFFNLMLNNKISDRIFNLNIMDIESDTSYGKYIAPLEKISEELEAMRPKSISFKLIAHSYRNEGVEIGKFHLSNHHYARSYPVYEDESTRAGTRIDFNDWIEGNYKDEGVTTDRTSIFEMLNEVIYGSESTKYGYSTPISSIDNDLGVNILNSPIMIIRILDEFMNRTLLSESFLSGILDTYGFDYALTAYITCDMFIKYLKAIYEFHELKANGESVGDDRIIEKMKYYDNDDIVSQLLQIQFYRIESLDIYRRAYLNIISNLSAVNSITDNRVDLSEDTWINMDDLYKVL